MAGFAPLLAQERSLTRRKGLFWRSQVVGVAYPVYASARALEHPASPERVANWLRYWCALACVSVIESAAGPQRFPGYHHAKLLLLLWLQSARYQGAARLYRLLLRPALEKLRPSMEAFLARAAALAPDASTQERPEAAAAAHSVHSVLASIPVVEWFVRSPPPDDAPAAPRSRRRHLIN